MCCEITFKVNKAENAIQQNFSPVFHAFVAEENLLPVFQFEPEVQFLSEEPVLNHGDSSPPPVLPLYLLNQQFII
ncbi:hypothetical protein D9M69_674630 [compost metagenome]